MAERRLATYRPQQPATVVPLLLLILAGVVAWLFFRNRQTAIATATQYANEERWDITYDKEGLPTRIVVHRQAKVD